MASPAKADISNCDDNERTVSFAGKGLKLDKEGDAAIIVAALDACVDLLIFNLEGNTLGIDAAKAIGKALESKSSFKIAIFKDMFTGRLKTEIPDALRFLGAGINLSGAQLQELDLSDNAFGPIGVQALAPFLKSECCQQLKILRLSNNGLGISGATMLSDSLRELKYLEIFTCGRNRLENEGSKAMAASLQTISTLNRLEMPQNGIRIQGIRAISKVIEANSDLRVINLNDNTITADGARFLAPILAGKRKLEVINFGDCLLKSEGTIALLKALKDNDLLENLSELVLSGNEIGGREVTDLIMDIFSSDSIDFTNLKLDLSGNEFGQAVVDELLNELSSKINIIIEDDEGDVGDDEGEQGSEEDETEDDEKTQAEQGEKVAKATETWTPKSDLISLQTVRSLIENPSTSINELCKTFVDISVSEYDSSTESLEPETLKKTDLLLEAIANKNKSFDAANGLLAFMGLIKSEEKYHKKKMNRDGPFIALSAGMKFLDKNIKNVLQLFLSKHTSVTEGNGRTQHTLMQLLYA